MANQVTGNIGMYYAAFKLSQMGWNVMPQRGTRAASTF
jgi:hypothetical protein